MSQHTILYPRQAVPELTVDTVGGGSWTLNDGQPENFTLVVFYRGLHCPICARYLAELNRQLPALAERGVDVIAISSDDEERATETRSSWEIPDLTLAYGLSLSSGREWGLFISRGRGKTSIGIEEPELFTEPALYLIRPDGTLYFGSVQTMPFVRPSFRELIGALDWILANDYPGRGEVFDAELATVASTPGDAR